MPTDLQASSSSSSSIRKQSSLDESYGFDKSKMETSLSKELNQTHLNGSINSFYCCTPIGLKCCYDEEGKNRIHSDLCRVVCSNYNCDQSGWIHTACLSLWEQKIRADIMKSNPQIRAACLDRQRSFTPWLEVIQNLIPKSYLCPCNQGTLRKFDHNSGPGTNNAEASYFAGQNNSNRRKLVPNSHMQVNNQSGSSFLNNGGNRKNSLDNSSINSYINFTKRFRSRTLSANQMLINYSTDGRVLSPTEFSPQMKDFLPTTIKPQSQQNPKPVANGMILQKSKPQNRQRHHSASYHGSNSICKEELVSLNQPNYNLAGNIFRQRNDFNNFQRLPFSKQNAYFIQMEDDSCTGNDDTKVFLLSHLSQLGLNTVTCLICASQLVVYDHLPLIDGTFFLSPLCHSPSCSIPISASSHPPGTAAGSNNSSGGSSVGGHQQPSQALEKFLNVVCINCMHEIVICCQFCHRPWTGAQLLIGSLYTYDIFAAVPCCVNRLLCNSCSRVCIDLNVNSVDSISNKSINLCLPSMLSNFSQLSRLIECTNCHTRDYHFVKPFANIFRPIV